MLREAVRTGGKEVGPVLFVYFCLFCLSVCVSVCACGMQELCVCIYVLALSPSFLICDCPILYVTFMFNYPFLYFRVGWGDILCLFALLWMD